MGEVSGEKPHQWTVFVRGVEGVASKDRLGVEQVTFYLHPDFKPSMVQVSKPPFEVTRKGWGAFEMDIDIKFEDGTLQQVTHDLIFNKGITFTTIDFATTKRKKHFTSL